MSTWRITANGLRTVVELELKQRIRSKRWIWALLAWFVLIGAVTGLTIWAAYTTARESGYGGALNQAGPVVFGIITFFVLGMGLMIAPAFTATSINGDRAAGTLATLQATRLSAVEIATGKLIAAWLAAAVFLVVALPFIVWSMVFGSISVWQVLVVFLVVLAEVAVICAVGLGWSALISRTAGSTLMTYLSVIALTVISGILMAMLVGLTVGPHKVQVWGLPPAAEAEWNQQTAAFWEANPESDGSGAPLAPVDKCTWAEVEETTYRPDMFWGLLVINPFVVVADAAPLPPGAAKNLGEYVSSSADPLAAIRMGVRELGTPPKTQRDDCVHLYDGHPGYKVNFGQGVPEVWKYVDGKLVPVESPVKAIPVNVEVPIWPWGLGFHVLLGAGFFWLAVRRLAIPYAKLAKGTRVA